MAGTTLVQYAWRIRTDSTAAEGGTPVWGAAEDTVFDPAVSTPFRIRFSIENTGGSSAAAHAWSIFVSRNSGAYAGVSTSSSYVQAVDATAGASSNGSAITSALLTGASGTFASGVYCDVGGTAPLALSGNCYTEFEFGLEFTSSAVAGDTYAFEVYFNGAALNTYNKIPTLTIPVSISQNFPFVPASVL